ncbi:hypothetical protein T01_11582 [Trichinella spiralis]|uniref:Uncharacterized protein n=1 Tax=Trichinella spiralis TaxID=6334 RepID=A0A0V1B900_TRISP|nr:hypothetical protein T01_11582 [Trichinella spiralis]
MTGRLFICFCILVIVLLLGLKIQARTTTTSHRRHSKHKSSLRRNIVVLFDRTRLTYSAFFFHQTGLYNLVPNNNSGIREYSAKMDLFDLFCPKPIPVQMLIN